MVFNISLGQYFRSAQEGPVKVYDSKTTYETQQTTMNHSRAMADIFLALFPYGEQSEQTDNKAQEVRSLL